MRGFILIPPLLQVVLERLFVFIEHVAFLPRKLLYGQLAHICARFRHLTVCHTSHIFFDSILFFALRLCSLTFRT